MKRMRIAAWGSALGIVLAATPALALSPAAEVPVPVTIVSRAYQPARLTVEDGQTVIWTNRGFGAHTVTALDGEFDSGRLNLGENFRFVFTTPGTFAYKCTVHPSMRGSVTVLAPGRHLARPPGSLQVHMTRIAGRLVVHVRAPVPDAAVLLLLHQEGADKPWRRVREAHLNARGEATFRLGADVHRQLRVVVEGGGPRLIGKPLTPPRR